MYNDKRFEKGNILELTYFSSSLPDGRKGPKRRLVRVNEYHNHSNGYSWTANPYVDVQDLEKNEPRRLSLSEMDDDIKVIGTKYYKVIPRKELAEQYFKNPDRIKNETVVSIAKDDQEWDDAIYLSNFDVVVYQPKEDEPHVEFSENEVKFFNKFGEVLKLGHVSGKLCVSAYQFTNEAVDKYVSPKELGQLITKHFAD